MKGLIESSATEMFLQFDARIIFSTSFCLGRLLFYCVRSVSQRVLNAFECSQIISSGDSFLRHCNLKFELEHVSYICTVKSIGTGSVIYSRSGLS